MTKTETKHTPLPWVRDDRRIHPKTGLTYPDGVEPETTVIVMVDTDQHSNMLLHETDRANLDLIVLSVNERPDLLLERDRLAGQVAELTKALRMISARINGVFDDPELVQFGPLAASTIGDVERIVSAVTAPAPTQTQFRKGDRV